MVLAVQISTCFFFFFFLKLFLPSQLFIIWRKKGRRKRTSQNIFLGKKINKPVFLNQILFSFHSTKEWKLLEKIRLEKEQRRCAIYTQEIWNEMVKLWETYPCILQWEEYSVTELGVRDPMKSFCNILEAI